MDKNFTKLKLFYFLHVLQENLNSIIHKNPDTAIMWIK